MLPFHLLMMCLIFCRSLQYCVGQQSCTVAVTPEIFGGDPCPSVMKKLSVEVVCSWGRRALMCSFLVVYSLCLLSGGFAEWSCTYIQHTVKVQSLEDWQDHHHHHYYNVYVYSIIATIWFWCSCNTVEWNENENGMRIETTKVSPCVFHLSSSLEQD